MYKWRIFVPVSHDINHKIINTKNHMQNQSIAILPKRVYDQPYSQVLLLNTEQIICDSNSGTLEPWQVEILD